MSRLKYANNPLDTGGETYKEIDRNFNPNWSGWMAVDRAKKQSRASNPINRILGNDSILQADVEIFYKIN